MAEFTITKRGAHCLLSGGPSIGEDEKEKYTGDVWIVHALEGRQVF